MSDQSLAHRAQHATRTETVHLPAATPPVNHGKTVAGWTTAYGVVIGGLVASVGVVLALVWLFWAGLGLAVAALILGKVLQGLGYGQGGSHTVARDGRAGAH
ncbi:HGxxPAAW family protein [Cellulomonas fimi]|uniref:Uncharacterized protein n=1 Tax=Cellulomonas fimi (strain ATCC 484 / DSM 20113 / JCM 1341 / CCUG 24087 / LMG 16345 / NBRC 15513 / NCIMB 8980 / NCTC 7547 / NRS-133) TaxID=590998 RepID=F4GYE4_CELFA|nr:HGxxPAAW family protein [Cellulomonas fimi]AEE45933.1 hypothetical protein Celf_1803 [Cellulomonas fimi ATCC 484]NNH06519.1 hypothetical protein [Cellulomonas fimi]VEH31044.1 Uncharacterised protein [Cellulomonas fimi]